MGFLDYGFFFLGNSVVLVERAKMVAIFYNFGML